MPKKTNIYGKLKEIRVYIPALLADSFFQEAEKEHRRYGEQLTKVFEDRYTTKPTPIKGE